MSKWDKNFGEVLCGKEDGVKLGNVEEWGWGISVLLMRFTVQTGERQLS